MIIMIDEKTFENEMGMFLKETQMTEEQIDAMLKDMAREQGEE